MEPANKLLQMKSKQFWRYRQVLCANSFTNLAELRLHRGCQAKNLAALFSYIEKTALAKRNGTFQSTSNKPRRFFRKSRGRNRPEERFNFRVSMKPSVREE